MLSLWQMSLSASAVILLTALLRRLAGPRLPRRMYVALWDVALLASLLPVRVPWKAFEQLSQALPSAPAQTVYAPEPAVLAGTAIKAELPAVSGIQDSFSVAVRSVRETAQTAPAWLWQAVGVAWMVGALALAAALLYRWLSCRRAFAEALPCEDKRVSAFLREHPLRRSVRVRVSDRIDSPLSYGLLRPVILLPVSLKGMDDRSLTYVLTHEFMHIRAWDMLRKSALLFGLCLHWFNPLIWLMIRLCNRDLELMCDERVVRRLGGCKAYCLTLLDMEVQRSDLTMGTCFSVTGIEERIKVMKNRKHQSILSIALAFAILLGATAGAMTGIPLADAESASPRLFFSPETWANSYAKYEPYGLGYDEKNGTITYNGQVVRYFEDMWPIDEQGKAGACFMYEDGTIDVYGVREFSETIQRNPDGSFDPSGTLVGLREATEEEYDERTARQTAEYLSPGAVTEMIDVYQLTDTAVFIRGDAQAVAEPLHDVEWWTAEDFREWVEQERASLQELVDEHARSWTPSMGWFTWTQEIVDETMAQYESMLQSIERGAYVSRTINGEDANMVLVQELGDDAASTAKADTVTGSSAETPSVEGVSLASAAEELAQTTFISEDSNTILYAQEQDLGSDAEGSTTLIAVSPDDVRRYSPEEWADIQMLIKQGVVQYIVSSTPQPEVASPTPTPTPMPEIASPTPQPQALLGTDQALRMEEWRVTIAPYAPFGLSYALDTSADLVRLYWNGQEVRGVFDPVRGTWTTEHAGNGNYPDGAKELIAVYENDVLVGLREADAEENAVWDKLRSENTKQ